MLPATRKVLVAFAVLTLLATNQLVVVASFTDRYFAWTISVRATSAFLGAAYAAGFLLAVLALRRNRWRDVRVALVTVTVFTVLTLVPTLIHLHVFHLWNGGWGARLAAWVWLAIYVVVPIACLTVVVRQHAAAGRGDPRSDGRCPAGSARSSPSRGSRCSASARCMFLGGIPGAPPAGRGDELLALAADAVGRPGDRCVAAGPGRRDGAGHPGARPGPAPGARGDVHGLRGVPAAGGSAVLVAVPPDYQWGWPYVGLLVSIAATGAYGCWAATRASVAAGEADPVEGENSTTGEFSTRS